MSSEKVLVERLVAEVMNGRNLDALGDLCSPRLARQLRRAFEQFIAAFPDWHQEIVQLVHESETVVARFRCTGTHLGEWLGDAPTKRTMRVDEVYFFSIKDGRLDTVWGLEDTWTRKRQLSGDVTELGRLGSIG